MADKLKIGYERGTIFGGCLTLLAGTLILAYVVHNLVMIYDTKEHKYTKEDIIMSDHEIVQKPYALKNFGDNFNFIFGFGNLDEDFDILNNPYVEFHGFEMTLKDGSKLHLEDKYAIEKCSGRDFGGDFVPADLLDSIYPQALCLSESAAVEIRANWFSSKFELLNIGIAYCSDPDKHCESKDEVDKWLKDHPAFFVH